MKKTRKHYPVHTSGEADALMRATSDGKSGRNWRNVEGAGARVHQAPGAAHYVQLVLTDGEREAGLELNALNEITEHCTADDNFALLYITRRLVPDAPLPTGALAGAVIELDEVIKAIGWNPLTTGQRAEMRRRVWQFLKFGANARIVGQRTYKQRDKMTGENIDTFIDSPAWLIGEVVREGTPPPTPQPSLFEADEPPLSVHVAATPIWTQLTAVPQMAQFLPLGEVLGAIPGGKPAGAWARVIGLALSNFWRRKPREAMTGKIKPTRRELLERYTPSTGSVAELLGSLKSARAVEYWAGALQILVECGFLANEGEAAAGYDALREKLPFRAWQEDWLNGVADLRPGPAMVEAIQNRADALPERKPKRLKTGK